MKVKNVYLEENNSGCSTGLILELEDGRRFKQQSTDIIKHYEQILED